MNYNTDEVKEALRGREVETLSRLSQVAHEACKSRNHIRCPLPDHDDSKPSFRWDAPKARFICSCGSYDVFAFLMKVEGWTFPQCIKAVAEVLGVKNAEPAQVDIVERVARDKRIPVDAFRQFGAEKATRGRKNFNVARVPVYNESGEVHSYFDLAPGEKGWFKRGEGSSGLFLPGRLPKPGETWMLVEGVKDAAALFGLGYNACGMPTNALNEKYARLFSECDVVLVPDLDDAAWTGQFKTGGNLSMIAKDVRVARLPGEIRKSGGDDVRDVLAQSNGETLVRAAVDEASPWEGREGDHDVEDGRPEVLVTLNEAFVTDQVLRHLGELGWASPWVPRRIQEPVKMFHRAGRLTQVLPHEDIENAGRLHLRTIPPSITRERITQACRLIQEKEDTQGNVSVVSVSPPRWLVDACVDRQHFDGMVRPIEGIIYAPTIRRDGSILQRPGYDSKTGLLYQSLETFPQVPDRPTQDDARRCAGEVLDVVKDFPFVADADRSAWLALVLTMIGRACLDGCVPLFSVTANVRGSGKSKLVDCASIIAYGRAAPRKSFTHDNDETRKMVTATIMEGSQSALLDNVDIPLGGAALDSVLTATTWEDRILGKSTTTGCMPMRTVWTATGNNLSYRSDVARRVLPIRLDSPLECPENRDDMEQQNLEGWVKNNRARLATAALTIMRGYFNAEKPRFNGDQWGSFEAWAQVVRNAVMWAGCADPLSTREQATAQDETRDILAALITGLEEADPDSRGLTTKEIERLTTYRPDQTPSCPMLVEAVGLICGNKFNSRVFGRRAKSLCGRVWQDRKLTSTSAGKGVKKWIVRGWVCGLGGFSPPQGRTERVVCTPHDAYDTRHDTYRELGECNQQNPQTHPVKEQETIRFPADGA